MPTSPTAVLQRVRNRIIEYLELASSFDAQIAYQVAVPAVRVPHEVINQWEDLVDGDWQSYEPVLTSEEIIAIKHFHSVWEEVCDATPSELPSLDELFLTSPWRRLAAGATEALAVLVRVGPHPDFDR